MCSLFAQTGGSVQSRKYSQPLFSGCAACNLIFKWTVVPWVNSSFQVRLRAGETRGLFRFLKRGLKRQWVWDATAVSMVTIVNMGAFIQQVFLCKSSWQGQ